MPLPKDTIHYKALLKFLEEHPDGHVTRQEKTYLQALSESPVQADVAAQFGVAPNTICSRTGAAERRAAVLGFSPPHDMVNTAPPGFRVKGVSTYYDKDGVPSGQWVKTNAKDIALQEAMEAFTDALADRVEGRAKLVPPPDHTNADLLAMYILGDPHAGMRAWAKETGAGNFDTNIFERETRQALNDLVNAAPHAERGLLVSLGDLFHLNTPDPRTPGSGHILDTDGRYSHTIDAVGRVFQDTVELMLQKHDRVDLLLVRGNHDPFASLFMAKVLDAYYRNEPRVTVIPNERKLIEVEHGKTGLFFHHGDRINFDRFYKMVTRQFGEMWGRCVHRFLHMGHLHHHKAEELGGANAEIWQVLCEPDAYHAGSGYGSAQSATVVTYHKEWGEVGRNRVPIGLVRERLKAA